jgi:RND superfamily putative drug exporter
VSSRTVVVERDPAGLGADRLQRTAARVVEVNRGRLEPLSDAAGAYGVTNAVVRLPFARERGTTTLSYLLFPPDFSQRGRTARAQNYVRSLEVPQGFVGVTGAVPARAAQAEVISERLPLLEVVTLAVVALAVAVYLRSAVAPLVTLVTVAICYLLSVRLVTVVGSAVGVSVPAEVEPIVVALLFGVVTDYGLFYMSRFRRRLAEGDAPVEASRRTIVDLTPIVLACGLAVAAGSAALGVAELGFLRAFGPGMALAILVACSSPSPSCPPAWRCWARACSGRAARTGSAPAAPARARGPSASCASPSGRRAARSRRASRSWPP